MATAVLEAATVPLLINGKWTRPDAESFGDVFNPSTGEVIAKVPMCGAKEVDAAAEAASRAFIPTCDVASFSTCATSPL